MPLLQISKPTQPTSSTRRQLGAIAYVIWLPWGHTASTRTMSSGTSSGGSSMVVSISVWSGPWRSRKHQQIHYCNCQSLALHKTHLVRLSSGTLLVQVEDQLSRGPGGACHCRDRRPHSAAPRDLGCLVAARWVPVGHKHRHNAGSEPILATHDAPLSMGAAPSNCEQTRVAGPGSAHWCLRRWRQGHQAGHDSTGLNYLPGVHLCRTPGGRLNAGGCGASACNKSGQHVLRRPSPGTACWPPKVRPSTRSSWRWQSLHRFCGLRAMTR